MKKLSTQEMLVNPAIDRIQHFLHTASYLIEPKLNINSFLMLESIIMQAQESKLKDFFLIEIPPYQVNQTTVDFSKGFYGGNNILIELLLLPVDNEEEYNYKKSLISCMLDSAKATLSSQEYREFISEQNTTGPSFVQNSVSHLLIKRGYYDIFERLIEEGAQLGKQYGANQENELHLLYLKYGTHKTESQNKKIADCLTRAAEKSPYLLLQEDKYGYLPMQYLTNEFNPGPLVREKKEGSTPIPRVFLEAQGLSEEEINKKYVYLGGEGVNAFQDMSVALDTTWARYESYDIASEKLDTMLYEAQTLKDTLGVIGSSSSLGLD